MDYAAYKQKYYANPEPEPRYSFTGAFSVALYYENYAEVVAYYTQALGPPAYVEGAGTRGWRIGKGWLTLFQGKSGKPENVEIAFVLETPEEAEELQRAFIDAGGTGDPPSDELMYEPIRFCGVTDPFGTKIIIISPLQSD
ncbi:MAG: hypothetical protein ISR58_06870 [Anaerolineales bacterium]|nr:hypothetical protein [Chloroflexota bacterium]MBL6980897.1 hypothetical protein [Anaerolineales bacterium]